ncbi:hypothetical protein ACIBLA_34160 [Streptomyces sp. NPDC050433]|uniref:hypothetical protein n=1 Tax=unclassified Streptomyces TaxID=2593676 RepID=UPI0034497A9B
MGRTGTTRRGALLAAGAAAGVAAGGLLTACSGADDEGGSGAAARAAAVRAAKALRAKSARTSRELLRQYDAVLERHPDQATRLTPLRAAVARHVTALAPPPQPPKKGESAKPSASASASASSAPSSDPSLGTAVGDARDTGTAPSVPADPRAALRELAAAERRTAEAHGEALVHAPPEFARLLASLAAAGAAHAFLLTEGSPS